MFGYPRPALSVIEPDDGLEGRLLLEAIYRRYGYDFRAYSEASMLRRLEQIRLRSGDASLSLLQHRLLHQPDFFQEILPEFTITTSEMFRDPDFFAQLRERVCPLLQTYPTLNIWHAGCSSGEEVYSLAILLLEQGLLERTQIYATDINRQALKTAREGIYPLKAVQEFTVNYHKSGGRQVFSDYYHAAYDAARMARQLQNHIFFQEHNLVSDGVFCEMHLVLCRNVLIYFQRPLQNRVLQLLSDSLCRGGFLCLGTKETLDMASVRDQFEKIDLPTRIYRKSVRQPLG